MGGADPFLLHRAADYLVALADNSVPKKPLLPIAAWGAEQRLDLCRKRGASQRLALLLVLADVPGRLLQA